jgi:hypothetical protein
MWFCMLDIDILWVTVHIALTAGIFQTPQTYLSPPQCFCIPIAIDSEHSSFMVTHLDRKDVASLGPQVVDCEPFSASGVYLNIFVTLSSLTSWHILERESHQCGRSSHASELARRLSTPHTHHIFTALPSKAEPLVKHVHDD